MCRVYKIADTTLPDDTHVDKSKMNKASSNKKYEKGQKNHRNRVYRKKIRFQNRQMNFVHIVYYESEREEKRRKHGIQIHREKVIGLTMFCQLNKLNRNNSNSSSNSIKQNEIYGCYCQTQECII